MEPLITGSISEEEAELNREWRCGAFGVGWVNYSLGVDLPSREDMRDCYPEIDPDQILWLAVAEVLAQERGTLYGWRRTVLSVCSDFDSAKDLVALHSVIFGAQAVASRRDELTTDAFAVRLGKTDRRPYLEVLTDTSEKLRTTEGLSWIYTALTATHLYCPEYGEHLRRYRAEMLVLEETVARCRISNGGDCVGKNPGLLTRLTDSHTK